MGMLLEEITESSYFRSLVGAGIFAIVVLASGVLHVILRIIGGRLQRHSPVGIAPQLLEGIRKPAVLFVVLLGAYLALTSIPDLEQWQDAIAKGWTALSVLVLSHSLATAGSTFITWYLDTIAPKTATGFDDRIFAVFRRVLWIIVYGVALLIILDTLGLSISPLLGGLGLTGLAVALAVQPTLGNFFAGTYVLSDGAIKTGDYIELSGGPAGYVINVGWRTTRIRTWLNTLVIIPNSVLADTIVTNYQAPDPAMNIIITCGVSYSSDLDMVQRVGLEVAREVLEDLPEAVKEMDPWFGYDSFGDSNIGFWIFVQAKDRIGSFIVTNELIKRLHARFVEEKIEINYPMRKLVYADGASTTTPVPGPTRAS
jgi:small-conductance mechanosensitive channel